MSTGFLLFSNIIAPLVAGLFFCVCFIYFVIASPSKSASFKYFVVFLISFAFFSFGRTLQLVSGPYPLPLVIVNARVFILCAVISPSIILAADVFNEEGRRLAAARVVVPCVLLGVTYCAFNTLGTTGSYILFDFGGFVAYDNLTPSGRPPFFGREVTIAVQCVTGALPLLFAARRLAGPHRGLRLKELKRDKNFLINCGAVVFAASFIVGSLSMQWWIYYAASIVSALFFGASVLIDAQDVHRYYERLIPFIKEHIIQDVAFSEASRSKLVELLACLGKKPDFDTFVAMNIRQRNPSPQESFALVERTVESADRVLTRLFGREHFLLLPLPGTLVGIALRAPLDAGGNGKAAILETMETLREELSAAHGCGLSIGIGRPCCRIEDLRTSYREAVGAQEFAERFEESAVIHVDDIEDRDRSGARYPLAEKERLLSAVRAGDAEKAGAALREFSGKFRPFVEDRPELLRVRLFELIGALIDAAALGGGDEEKLAQLAAEYAVDIDLLKDAATAAEWLERSALEIAGSVVRVRERRMNSLIVGAISFIEANYARPLSYKDVAREISISPSYFLNLFKKETGTTFVDFLTTARIEAAKRMLRSPDASVKEIAYAVGFNSSNYFSNTFRKIAGVSAKEFRESVPVPTATDRR